jgi:hypothetical protein
VAAIDPSVESRQEPRERVSSEVRHAPPLRSLVTAGFAVAFVYYVGASVGLQLRNPPTGPSFLWPPNAILTAVLLIAPPQRRWILLLAALPAHLLVQAQAGRPLLLALAFFVTNCSEAVIAYLLLRRWRVPLRFDSSADGRLHRERGDPGPLLSSFADAAVRTLIQGESCWVAWRTRRTETWSPSSRSCLRSC